MIYIIILAYNEERNIRGVVQEIASKLASPFQILVINDGSTDQTKAFVEALPAHCHARVIDHLSNRGVGEGFRTGLSAAVEIGGEDDVIVTMEADGTNDPEVVNAMERKILDGYDVVSASRYHKGGGYYGFPWKRLLYSWGANTFLSIFFPLKNIRDYTLFYRAYRMRVIRDALNHYGSSLITCKSFAANAEILLRLSDMGVKKMTEVGMRYDYSRKKSRSRIRIFKTILEYFELAWKLKISRPSKVLVPS